MRHETLCHIHHDKSHDWVAVKLSGPGNSVDHQWRPPGWHATQSINLGMFQMTEWTISNREKVDVLIFKVLIFEMMLFKILIQNMDLKMLIWKVA